MPGQYPPDITEQEKRLDRALCNFCNQAGDPFNPASQWDEYVRRDLAELSAAYCEWYKQTLVWELTAFRAPKAKVMKQEE